MKIAITGHTRGIGKALADYFKQSGHTVIGFSKSTGCDITQESHRNLIVDSLKTCDVFINNAYAYDAQKQLLIDAIEIWKDTKNTIVNIDSKSTLIEFPPAFIKEYVEDKNQQKKLIYYVFDDTNYCLWQMLHQETGATIIYWRRRRES